MIPGEIRPGECGMEETRVVHKCVSQSKICISEVYSTKKMSIEEKLVSNITNIIDIILSSHDVSFELHVFL